MIRMKVIILLLMIYIISMFGFSCSSRIHACNFSDRIEECKNELPSGFHGDFAISSHTLKNFKKRMDQAIASKEILPPFIGLYARSNVSLTLFVERVQLASRHSNKGSLGQGIPDSFWGHFAISDMTEEEFMKRLKKGEEANINHTILGEFAISELKTESFLARFNEAKNSGMNYVLSGKYATSNCSF